MRKLALFGISALAIGASAVAVGQTRIGAQAAETYRMLELFGDVVSIVERGYVVETDPKKLIEAALDGMLSSLDPHSNYLNAEDLERLNERSSGAYSGVGLEITSENGLIRVITPMDGGPALRAGVEAGDVITAINGQSTAGLTVAEVSEQLRGAAGESVVVTFLRDGQEPRDVTIVREVIRTFSVTSRMEGEFGYIRISTFNTNTGRELGEAIQTLRTTNPGLRGIVLDLRNNGGGLLDAAIAVSDAFLERGEIVSQRGRRANDIRRYNATAGDLTGGLPVAVLINYGSASASEIVAGALRDHERATLVGLTSFGKGSVQSVMPLRAGQDGALSLTTARYFTPSGQSIQRIGIAPDLEVARSRREAEIVARSSFIYSEAAYTNALDASVGSERRGPHSPEEAPPEDFPTDQDYQLQRALDLLRVGGDLNLLERRPLQVAAAADATEATEATGD
ncbi:MAG TPA: S41 family peptidase [Brevundimonas sp.]|uniref:S41 family peptidase n=1 Tax=Brevundimonas sp. TaxID=1871086 RepID=UPI002B9F982F|nr:S41 family peptidase [Brevundimonas sp.]HRH20369.1 S41 family peptidase [Brevundimonas sp.]